MKHLLNLFLLLLGIVSLSGQSFRFTNDGLSWGFTPEWDDWETNAFSLNYKWDKWEGLIDYRILTDRDTVESDSSRLDSILGESTYRFDYSFAGVVDLSIAAGLGIEAFGNFRGFEIQGGWHNNVEVSRQIPTDYDIPYQQVYLPLQVEVSLPLSVQPLVIARQSFHYPLFYSGYYAPVLRLPAEILPLQISLGYLFQAGETGIKTIDSVLEMKEGLRLSSELNFWPFAIGKSVYFNNQWGSGYIGILFDKPRDPAPEDTVMQLHFLGFSHQSYGVKIMREIAGIRADNLFYTGIYYESMSGWMDAPYQFPEGGRFSEILLGVEEGMKFNFGPFHSHIYLLINSGFTREQFYFLESTSLTPEYEENLWSYEMGGGVRFFFPFFFDRKMGLGFEISRKSSLFSWGNRPDGIEGTAPLNMKLSLSISS